MSFPEAASDAAKRAEGSTLSRVELPTSSSHSPLATGFSPGSPVCPTAAGQCLLPGQETVRTVNHQDSFLERPGQQNWWAFPCAWACMLPPGAQHRVPTEIRVTPQHTIVELGICRRLIKIRFIKVPVNVQEHCFRRCAQHLKWETKCRRLLHLLWTCSHSSRAAGNRRPKMFCERGFAVCASWLGFTGMIIV